jgi:hypothetical protein
VLPRCGPLPPPGFFAERVAGTAAATGGVADSTSPRDYDVVTRRPRVALEAGVRLVAALDAAGPAMVFFEEEPLAVLTVKPTVLGGAGAATTEGGEASALSKLMPAMPPTRSKASAAFVDKAAALWRMVAAGDKAQPATPGGAAARPANPFAGAASLLGDDFSGALGSGGGISAASVEEAALTKAKAYTIAVAQCVRSLESPHAAPWTTVMGLQLRDVFPDKDAARSSVQTAVLLQKLAAAVATAEGVAGFRLTVEELAALHGLAATDDGGRLWELFPGGPVMLAALTSCAAAVPFASAANCRLEICGAESGDDASGSASSPSDATLRVRCVASAAGAVANAESAAPLVLKGEPLKLWRRPLLRGEDAAAAQAAMRAEAPSTAARPEYLRRLPGETDAEAARRRILGFVDHAKRDPTVMQRAATSAQRLHS